jgi:membrane dipeptidase
MLPLFDAHCDTAGAIFEGGEPLRANTCQTDLLRGGAYAPRGQVYALWLRAVALAEDEVQRRFWAMLANFRREAAKNADMLSLCTSFDDLRAAFAAGKQAALLSVEGAELFGCSREGLERAFDQGVRIVHLCWNSDNALCGAAMGSGAGLTAQGRDFVRRCASLGIVIDLSHASDRTARDVLETGCVHVLAGHSNCRALANVPRNLPDELLRAIAAHGGVVGLNLYPDFLGGTDLRLAAGHIAHLLAVCGEDHVCLGCDLDGMNDLPEGVTGIESMPALRGVLADGGLDDRRLDNIFFNNLMSFWERAL